MARPAYDRTWVAGPEQYNGAERYLSAPWKEQAKGLPMLLRMRGGGQPQGLVEDDD